MTSRVLPWGEFLKKVAKECAYMTAGIATYFATLSPAVDLTYDTLDGPTERNTVRATFNCCDQNGLRKCKDQIPSGRRVAYEARVWRFAAAYWLGRPHSYTVTSNDVTITRKPYHTAHPPKPAQCKP